MQLYFRVTPLGLPRAIGNEEVLAVTAAFDRRTLARLQEMRGNNMRVLVTSGDAERRLAG